MTPRLAFNVWHAAPGAWHYTISQHGRLMACSDEPLPTPGAAMQAALDELRQSIEAARGESTKALSA